MSNQPFQMQQHKKVPWMSGMAMRHEVEMEKRAQKSLIYILRPKDGLILKTLILLE